MSDKKIAYLYEAKLYDVFEYFAKGYRTPPPGRHFVDKPEWIVDRERGLVVFKLFTEPDETPIEVAVPDEPTP